MRNSGWQQGEMGVSDDDSVLLGSNDYGVAKHDDPASRRKHHEDNHQVHCAVVGSGRDQWSHRPRAHRERCSGCHAKFAGHGRRSYDWFDRARADAVRVRN
jgi:hypothetical protein